MLPCVLLLLASAAAEEQLPASDLRPRHFNPHPYDRAEVLLSKFYQHLKQPAPTKQGPVLFPNDSSPPPKPPLIVTSRPLEESISRSELAPTNEPNINNSLAESTHHRAKIHLPNFAPINFYKNRNTDLYNYKIDDDPAYNYENDVSYKSVDDPYNQDYYKSEQQQHVRDAIENAYKAVTFKPELYTPSLYKPNLYTPGLYKSYINLGKHNTDVVGTYDIKKTISQHPYASLVPKSLLGNQERANRYNEYEEQTVLPPLYKAFSDYAQRKLKKFKQSAVPSVSPPLQQYHKTKPTHTDYDDYGNEIQNEGKKYAFSYSVKDHATGDDFSHSQRSSGSATNGEYRVRLPDGRMQIVSYTADEGGYKADVRYAEDVKPVVDNGIDQPNSGIGITYAPNINIAHPSASPTPRIYTHAPNINREDIAHPSTSPKPRIYQSNDYSQYDSRDYKDYAYENKIQYDFAKPIVVGDSFNEISKLTPQTATPSYDTILITPTKRPYYLQSTQKSVPFEINVPSTTPAVIYTPVTEKERVVRIGGSKPLYTSIRNLVDHYSPSTESVTQYPSSTVAPLHNRQNLGNFVNRFTKYFSFSN